MAGISAKHIKTRIRTMESTRQITRAMEMVSASRLRHTQAQLAASRPCFRTLPDTVARIASACREQSSPYLQDGAGNDVLFLVIAGDRGLAGGYNGNVLKLARSQMDSQQATVFPIGKKAVEYFTRSGIPHFPSDWPEAEKLRIGDCFAIGKTLADAYENGAFHQIHVVYTRFDSVLRQTPVSLRMLPLSPAAGRTPRAISFEPGPVEALRAIVPDYLGCLLYGALCESRCAEQAARRTAMNAATQNAGDLIGDLRLKYNQLRQAAITREITEIVAGTDA